jgi:hypothetical protein
MNIIKKSELMEFVSEKKQMLLGRKAEGAAEPAVAPPKTKPGTKPAPSKPKHPKPAGKPGPKARVAKLGEEKMMTKKVKINKKYPKKFVKEHINSYFSVNIVSETINEDYSVDLQLVGNKSELVKCLKNLKEGNVIN